MPHTRLTTPTSLLRVFVQQSRSFARLDRDIATGLNFCLGFKKLIDGIFGKALARTDLDSACGISAMIRGEAAQ